MSDGTRLCVTCQDTLFHYHDPPCKPVYRARLWSWGSVDRLGEQRVARRLRSCDRVSGGPAVAMRVRGTLEAPRIVRSACRTKRTASTPCPVAAAGREERRTRLPQLRGYSPAQCMVKGTCVPTRCREPKWARGRLAARSNWMEGGIGG